MDKNLKQFYKDRLLKERDSVYKLLSQMEKNETINMNVEMSSELSFYDNHPSDLASEMNDMERGMAFKEHEITVIKKIDEALSRIEDESYGKCKSCGIDIPDERLKFLPYAEYCVNCQNKMNSIPLEEDSYKPVEESALGRPFGYGYNDYDIHEDVGYDAEDSYEDVQSFETLHNIYENYQEDIDYVEPIEKISNQQYKNQLPD